MLGFRFESFDGFSREDFETFQESKWKSNRFNLERMKVRARMEALGREVTALLEPGVIPEGMTLQTTPDHPHIFNGHEVRHCWCYFDRPAAEKDAVIKVIDRDRSLADGVRDPIPVHHHALVGMGISLQGVEVFFRLHAYALLDRRNILARLQEPMEAAAATGVLSSLKDHFELHLDDVPLSLEKGADPVAVCRGALEGLQGWFRVGRGFDVQEARDLGPGLVQEMAGMFPPLLRFWEFVAWSRSNDRLNLSVALKKERREKAQKRTGLVPGDGVILVSGLLAGKEGTVVSVDHRGKVRLQMGRLSMEVDPGLLKKRSA